MNRSAPDPKPKQKPRQKAATQQKPAAKPLPPEAPVAQPPVVGVTAGQMLLNPADPREREILFAERRFAFIQRRAAALMSADIIPKAYKGNIGNCMIALDIAERLGVGEIEVMQNLDVIHNRPAWRARWLIGRINASGQLHGRLQYVFEDLGDKDVPYSITYYDQAGNKQTKNGTQKIRDKSCYCVGMTIEGQELEGPKITLEMAVQEGWYNKPGSKWLTIQQKMFMWRAGAWWADIHMPEAGLGFMTSEEASEATFSEREVGPGAPPKFRSAQEILDSSRREKAERAKEAGNDGAPESETDPANPDIDTDESIVNAMTYEEVATELTKAGDEDALFLAADLIRAVVDEKERADLGKIYDQCAARINEAAAD